MTKYRVCRSVEEVIETYLPKYHQELEEKRMREMSSEELGTYTAKKVIDSVRTQMDGIKNKIGLASIVN